METPEKNLTPEFLPDREKIKHRIDQLIEEFIRQEGHQGLEDLLRKALFPGRRMRPYVFLLLCGEHEKEEEEVKDHLALSIEFAHRASIIVDDLVDRDPMRRQVPAFYRDFGEKKTALMSEYIVISAYDHIQKIPEPLQSEAFTAFNEAYGKIILGEFADIGISEISSNYFNHYKDKVLSKTSALFELSFSFASIVNGSDDDKKNLMVAIGEKIGQLYQVHNDIYDELFSSEDERGEKEEWVLNCSLPLCLYLDRLEDTEKKELGDKIGKILSRDEYYSLQRSIRSDEQVKIEAIKYAKGISLELNSLINWLPESKLKENINLIQRVIEQKQYWNQKQTTRAGY